MREDSTGLLSGGNKDFVFGRNELGLHRLHDWIDYYVNARAERPLDVIGVRRANGSEGDRPRDDACSTNGSRSAVVVANQTPRSARLCAYCRWQVPRYRFCEARAAEASRRRRSRTRASLRGLLECRRNYSAHFLVSYTCDVIPGLEEQERLRSFVERGGRWFALHGTNSILRFLKSGEVDSPDWAPHFMETLGSMFIAHPPIGPYRVTVADPRHPLVTGIEPFEATDELYLTKTYGELQVLLETEFQGEAVGFVKRDWQRARHPVFYLHPIGQGGVLYLTLGHCRGQYDMQPLMKWYPEIERGAWNLPVFYELLRRGISWAKQTQESDK